MSSTENVCPIKRPRKEASAWCFTDTKDIEFSFAWTIVNFIEKMESYPPGKKLESSIFKVMVEGVETSWRLECYPGGETEEDSGTVNIFLVCTDITPLKTFSKRLLTYSLELVDKEGSGMCKRKSGMWSTDEIGAKGRGWYQLISHEKLKSNKSILLPRDCLEVYCVMKFDGPEVTTSGASSPTNLPLEPNEEVKGSGLVDLLETGVFADVELVCEERTFSCHKAILASKSPVFMATFRNNMKEKTTGHIKVEGIDPDTVKDMLIHIYGGKIENLEDKADVLLEAADRYDLKQLKKSCEEMLSSSLNLGNCLDCVVLADRHSSDSLKPVVLKFIVENFLEDKWMENLTNFPEVFQKVFDELASFRSSKEKTKNDEKEI